MCVSADVRLPAFPPTVFPRGVDGDSVLPAGCHPGQPFGDLIVFTFGTDGCGSRMESGVRRSQRARWRVGQGERGEHGLHEDGRWSGGGDGRCI